MTAARSDTPTVTAQLRDILDWAALLPALLTRRAPTGDSSRGGRPVPGSRPPVRLDVLQVLDDRERIRGDDAEDRAWHDRAASDHRQGLLPDLWQWCRMIESEAMDARPALPDELPERPNLASVVDWLTRHTAWAETQPWAGEYVADVQWWWRRLRELTGESERGSDVPCGRCGEMLHLVHVGLWECSSGHQVTIHPVSIREAARITEVPVATLHRWLRQSDAPRLTESPSSGVVYDLGTIRRVIAQRRLSGVG